MDDYVFKRRITGEVIEEMSLHNDSIAFEKAIHVATKYNDSIQVFRYIGTAEPELQKHCPNCKSKLISGYCPECDMHDTPSA